jgi:energy-coupling factor transport system permease protein
VLEDALARSLLLAAAMDSRGYGRSAHVPLAQRRTTSALVVGGLLGLCLGLYGLLDGTAPPLLGAGGLTVGFGLCAAGLRLGGRRVRTTTYRPDPWRRPETLVAASGLLSAAVLVAVGGYDPLLLHPSLDPLRWPDLPLLPLAAVLLGLLPAVVAPPPVRPARAAAPRRERVSS